MSNMTDGEMVPTGQPNTVLVVDDNKTARWLLAEILAADAYDVLQAESADEALRLLKERSDIRAVVTDIEMPGSINGLEMARRIVEEMPGVAVLLTSGRYVPTTESLPRSTRFMPKPWLPEEVLRHLDLLFGT
jgi:CheY-like chemotaxis protein